jgi:hypothetical protein
MGFFLIAHCFTRTSWWLKGWRGFVRRTRGEILESNKSKHLWTHVKNVNATANPYQTGVSARLGEALREWWWGLAGVLGDEVRGPRWAGPGQNVSGFRSHPQSAVWLKVRFCGTWACQIARQHSKVGSECANPEGERFRDWLGRQFLTLFGPR